MCDLFSNRLVVPARGVATPRPARERVPIPDLCLSIEPPRQKEKRPRKFAVFLPDLFVFASYLLDKTRIRRCSNTKRSRSRSNCLRSFVDLLLLSCCGHYRVNSVACQEVRAKVTFQTGDWQSHAATRSTNLVVAKDWRRSRVNSLSSQRDRKDRWEQG